MNRGSIRQSQPGMLLYRLYMKLSYKPFTVCSVVGCHLLTRSLPYCRFHAYKDKKYGDPLHVWKPKAKKVK